MMKAGGLMNGAKRLVFLLSISLLYRAAAAQAPAEQKPAVHPPAKGGVSAANADAQRRELEEFKQSAARYRIAGGTERTSDLRLVAEPVLRWTNPLRATFGGAVFLWTADGRPEVAASFYRYNENGSPVQDEEFQSLATTALTATRDGQSIWSPQAAGISFAPIPGAPRPAATAPERLRQMGALAREFHAFFDVPEDRTELRLLPKPLFRYQPKRADVSDGALFGFVVTTDPEVLLLIEARPAAGAPVWHYGFARMSMVNLKAQHKDRTVWKVDWVYDLRDPSKPYMTLRAPERRE